MTIKENLRKGGHLIATLASLVSAQQVDVELLADQWEAVTSEMMSGGQVTPDSFQMTLASAGVNEMPYHSAQQLAQEFKGSQLHKMTQVFTSDDKITPYLNSLNVLCHSYTAKYSTSITQVASGPSENHKLTLKRLKALKELTEALGKLGNALKNRREEKEKLDDLLKTAEEERKFGQKRPYEIPRGIDER
ncbi:MAG TPA: hypothetical protein PKZ53_26665 [Acidobacteriota bacterium]|nr:hypothetical protein [Acidobacteriota bacterium]